MPRYPFYQVDAFTDKSLEGNPCAIIMNADDLQSATMQQIALENNLSETSFVLRSEVADFRRVILHLLKKSLLLDTLQLPRFMR